MKVWVLTGDKQETATSIAYAAKLITEEQRVLTLCGESVVSYLGARLFSYMYLVDLLVMFLE